MIFDLDRKKHILKSSLYSNLAQTAIHFRLEKEDFFIISFVMSIVIFIITYLVIWSLTLIYSLFRKKRQWEIHIHAFYFTMIVLFANNILLLVIKLVNYLFKIDLEKIEILDFSTIISLATTPFFIILLLTWLSIKVSQYLRNRGQNVS
jgi:hypothetical protein